MKVSVEVARQNMKFLVNAGATFNWVQSSINGSWLTFEIKLACFDGAEVICERISNDWAFEIDNENNIAHFELFDISKDSVREKKQLLKVRQWLTRRSKNPIPMRTMECEVLRETSRAIHVKLTGHLRPSSSCNHCGRRLTHAVSLLYGLGPICGGHFHINPCHSEEELERRYNEMAKKMASVTWEGWIPRSQVESLVTV